MYAIVDIETTGGNAKTGKITEIAIYVHDGSKIIDELCTLVNPEVPIPAFITNLTGISNEMVRYAPKFYEVAKRIVEITEGLIFIGHNVLFDYSFVKNEFETLGYEYKRRTLCTVRLSRKLLPGKKSYSLGKLCKDVGIPLNNAHRAAADARATVTLFEMLMQIDRQNQDPRYTDPYASLIESNRLLTQKMIADLPEKTGVYYFYDHSHTLIYVGKSNNIRQRVLSHFRSNETRKAQDMKEAIAHIQYKLTGSELVALLMESQCIKEQRPKFNRAQRRIGMGIGLFAEYDWDGYIRFRVDTVSGKENPITTFRSKDAARNFLFEIVRTEHLCQKLCGLYKSEGECFHYGIKQCNGACKGEEPAEDYNVRAARVVARFKHKHESFLLVDQGRSEDENAIVLVEHGKYVGYGFAGGWQRNPLPIEDLRQSIQPCLNTRTAHQLISSFIHSNDQIEVLPI